MAMEAALMEEVGAVAPKAAVTAASALAAANRVVEAPPRGSEDQEAAAPNATLVESMALAAQRIWVAAV